MKITKNNYFNVYKCKTSSIETMDLKGYEHIDTLFVDNSGFGQEGEMALTKNGFENRLKYLLDTHGTLTAKIVNAGMFQVYIGLFKKTGKSKIEKLENNTYKIQMDNGYAIRLHNTNVLTFNTKDNTVVLDNGGYQSVTSKDRINKYLPNNTYYVYQKNYNWYIKNVKDNTSIDYQNGITLKI